MNKKLFKLRYKLQLCLMHNPKKYFIILSSIILFNTIVTFALHGTISIIYDLTYDSFLVFYVLYFFIDKNSPFTRKFKKSNRSYLIEAIIASSFLYKETKEVKNKLEKINNKELKKLFKKIKEHPFKSYEDIEELRKFTKSEVDNQLIKERDRKLSKFLN